MKRAFLAACILFTLCGCENEAERVQREATDKLTNQAQQQVGMPGVTKFTERRLLKQIYELRDDEKLVCYAYTESLDGHLRFLTKCLGFGIPYSTQFTRPHNGGEYSESVEQAEPNGLYPPTSAEGTWLMIPDAAGTAHPVYCEPRVVVSPIKIATALDNPME